MSSLPQHMTGAIVHEYGEPKSVLKLDSNLKLPTCGNNQLLIQMCCSSINPVDWKIMNGQYKELNNKNLPFIPGQDFSGIVVSIGSSCKNFKVGDKVFGDGTTGTSGTWAQYAVVDENKVHMLPNTLTWEEAGCVGLAGLTALQGLMKHGNLQSGQRILILAGSGGVGHIAIQIAKSLGAYVITTGASQSMEFLQSLGADKIINYETQDLIKELSNSNDKVNLVFDCVGGKMVNNQLPRVLLSGGKIVSIVGDAKLDEADKSKYMVFIKDSVDANGMKKLVDLIAAKKLKLHIEKVYSLQEINKLVEKSMSGHCKGKLALKIADMK